MNPCVAEKDRNVKMDGSRLYSALTMPSTKTIVCHTNQKPIILTSGGGGFSPSVLNSSRTSSFGSVSSNSMPTVNVGNGSSSFAPHGNSSIASKPSFTKYLDNKDKTVYFMPPVLNMSQSVVEPQRPSQASSVPATITPVTHDFRGDVVERPVKRNSRMLTSAKYRMKRHSFQTEDDSTMSNHSTSARMLPNLTCESDNSFTNFHYEYNSEVSKTLSPSPVHHHQQLRRSISDKGMHTASQGSVGTSSPLDLTVDKKRSSRLQNPEPLPAKLNLMVLAEAVSFVIENDNESKDVFYGYRSSPSCSLESHSSANSVTDSDSRQEYDPDTFLDGFDEPRNRVNTNNVNFTLSRGDCFQTDGIILNSNVEGDKIYSDNEYKMYHQQLESSQNSSETDAMFDKVANLSMEQYPNYFPPYLNGDECKRISAMKQYSNSKGYMKMHGYLPPPPGVDLKKRFRLAKHQYEKMSESDRRVRHRVLDNQRSKQYRERRRKMVNNLQEDVSMEETRNCELVYLARRVQREVKVLQLVLKKARSQRHLVS